MFLDLIHFESYDTRDYGTPWAAVCDHAGKPQFRVQQAYYTGQPGEAGALLAEDPVEGSVWMYGQKGFRGNLSLKGYLYVRGGEVHPVPEGMELEFFVTAPDLPLTEARQAKLALVFLKELLQAEATRRVPDVDKILKRHRISCQELKALGLDVTYDPEKEED